jgi:hypothetical protein
MRFASLGEVARADCGQRDEVSEVCRPVTVEAVFEHGQQLRQPFGPGE